MSHEEQTEFPEFRFFPDPVRARAFVRNEDDCVCCRKARGWILTAHVLDRRVDGFEVRDPGVMGVCPWCVADGSAAARGGFEFNFTRTSWAEGGPGQPVAEGDEEVRLRTPGYPAGQPRSCWPDLDGRMCVFQGWYDWAEAVALGEAAAGACLDAVHEWDPELTAEDLGDGSWDVRWAVFLDPVTGKFLAFDEMD